MKIKPFAVEEWMNRYEVGARYNIAETCVDSVSAAELFALTGEDAGAFWARFSARRLTYGDIEGAIKNLAAYLNEHNAVDRFSTWALPINMSMINGGFQYACAYAEGKTNGKVDVEYLQKCYSEAAGSDIEFTKYVDASGNTYDNYLLIALDPINFADYLAD